MKATMVPVLEKLLSDGALYAYQIDVETVHSSDPNSLNIVIIANGPDGIDKFNAAIDDMEKNNPSAEAGLGSMLDTRGHRDILAHVDAMSYK